ncbi:acyl-CoA thioesterase [bacterium]|nr:acyl-CoA thioesterase [bacterium]
MRILRISLQIVCSLLSRKRISPLEPLELSLRVWPGDVDLRFVNQSVYFFYLELARWDLIYRSKLGRTMRELECIPVVAAQSIRILKPIKRFSKVCIETQFSHWDDKWVYIEHKMHCKGKLVARALVKGLFKNRRRVVPTQELLSRTGLDGVTAKPNSRTAELWNNFEDSLFS